jgi:hypothetical protein
MTIANKSKALEAIFFIAVFSHDASGESQSSPEFRHANLLTVL